MRGNKLCVKAGVTALWKRVLRGGPRSPALLNGERSAASRCPAGKRVQKALLRQVKGLLGRAGAKPAARGCSLKEDVGKREQGGEISLPSGLTL